MKPILLFLLLFIVLLPTVTASNIIASDSLRYSNDAPNRTILTTWQKISSITITDQLSGTLKVSFDLKTDGSSGVAHAQLRKNGAIIGTERIITGNTEYTTFSENISVNMIVGDKLEMWGYVNSGYASWVQNFRLYYDIVPRGIHVWKVWGKGEAWAWDNTDYSDKGLLSISEDADTFLYSEAHEYKFTAIPANNWKFEKWCMDASCITVSNNVELVANSSTSSENIYLYIVPSYINITIHKMSGDGIVRAYKNEHSVGELNLSETIETITYMTGEQFKFIAMPYENTQFIKMCTANPCNYGRIITTPTFTGMTSYNGGDLYVYFSGDLIDPVELDSNNPDKWINTITNGVNQASNNAGEVLSLIIIAIFFIGGYRLTDNIDGALGLSFIGALFCLVITWLSGIYALLILFYFVIKSGVVR